MRRKTQGVSLSEGVIGLALTCVIFVLLGQFWHLSRRSVARSEDRLDVREGMLRTSSLIRLHS